MKLNRKQLQGLGTGLQMGGVFIQSLDADRAGADDEIGRACQTAGVALAQLSQGESVTKQGKAADALDAVGDACKALAGELRGGG